MNPSDNEQKSAAPQADRKGAFGAADRVVATTGCQPAAAAPDGVVVPRELAGEMLFEMWRAVNGHVGGHDHESLRYVWRRTLTAAPPPAPSDDRLSGLRNEVLEEAAMVCEENCSQQAAKRTVRSDDAAHAMSKCSAHNRDAATIRSLKTEAAQKDQREAARPKAAVGSGGQPTVREIIAADSFRDTLLPRRDAVDAGGYPLWHGWVMMDAFLAGAEFARAEHCLPAAREDGPSLNEVEGAEDVIANIPKSYLSNGITVILACAVLRWHAKKGGKNG